MSLNPVIDMLGGVIREETVGLYIGLGPKPYGCDSVLRALFARNHNLEV